MLADVTARANCPTINYVWLEANIIYTRVQQVAVCQNISSVLQNIPSLAKIWQKYSLMHLLEMIYCESTLIDKDALALKVL